LVGSLKLSIALSELCDIHANSPSRQRAMPASPRRSRSRCWRSSRSISSSPSLTARCHLLRAVRGPAHEDSIDYPRVAIRASKQKLEEYPAVRVPIRSEPAPRYRLAGGGA
jgi:hypothetical protein